MGKTLLTLTAVLAAVSASPHIPALNKATLPYPNEPPHPSSHQLAERTAMTAETVETIKWIANAPSHVPVLGSSVSHNDIHQCEDGEETCGPDYWNNLLTLDAHTESHNSATDHPKRHETNERADTTVHTHEKAKSQGHNVQPSDFMMLAHKILPYYHRLMVTVDEHKKTRNTLHERDEQHEDELNKYNTNDYAELANTFMPFYRETRTVQEHLERTLDPSDEENFPGSAESFVKDISTAFEKHNDAFRELQFQGFLDNEDVTEDQVIHHLVPIYEVMEDTVQRAEQANPETAVKRSTTTRPDYENLAKTFIPFGKQLKKILEADLEKSRKVSNKDDLSNSKRHPTQYRHDIPGDDYGNASE